MKRHDDLTPLRMSLAGGAPTSRTGPVALFVALVAVTLVATAFTSRSNDRQTEIANRARTQSVVDSIEDRIAVYDEVLYGVRTAFSLDPDLDRSRFASAVSQVRAGDRLTGIQVIGAAHVVRGDEVADFVAETDRAAREADLGYPAFEPRPEPDADLRLLIDFMEPVAGNERAFGLDFLGEPNRRDAAMRARDSGGPSVTAPITLVQETGEQRAFLIMLPMYEPGEPIATLTERRAAFTGVVYVAVRMGDLVTGALGDEVPSGLVVADVASGDLFYGDAGTTDLDDVPEDGRVEQIAVASRPWLIVVDDGRPVLSAVQDAVPLLALVGGLLLAGLLAGLVEAMRSAGTRAIRYAAEMNDELQALSESTSEGIVTIDTDGRIVAWNRGATEIFTAPADDALGRPAGELFPEGDRERFEALSESVLADDGGSVVRRSLVTAGLRSDGSAFPAELSFSRWSARGSDYLTVFVRDVTDRVEAEQRMVDTRDLLLGVLAAATEVAIVGVDLDGRVEVFNVGAERILGLDSSDALGLDPAGAFDPDELARRAAEVGCEPGFEAVVALARRGDADTREWTWRRGDGSTLAVELAVTPRRDSDGELCGFIGIAVDVTERVAAQRRQQALLEQEREMVAKLREVDRVKSDFVSTMSHELRTPLTSILGYTELLADSMVGVLPPTGTSMIGTIEKNAQRLLSLVEDLLSLSRIESGSLNPRREPCDLPRLVETACTTVAPTADGRGITIRCDVDPTAPVVGDASQLERVVLNLLTNAVKFSRDGGTVELSLHGDERTVELEVRDHGIGIPADEQQHLFTRFFRSRSAERNAIPGTGLGLTIVASIVGRHGGSIAVDSAEDVGTTVRVTLPAAAATHPNHPDDGDLAAVSDDPAPTAQEALV